MLGDRDLIVLPPTRGISDAAWGAIQTAVEQGTWFVSSGRYEADDAGNYARRLGLQGRQSFWRARPGASTGT